MKKTLFNTSIFFLSLFLSIELFAQPIPVNDQAVSAKYPFVSAVFNRIFNAGGLDSFYRKLYRLKKNNTGTLSIVHIGDSHIQPDFLSGIVRTGLQDFFGNAGRGLIFPYQLAQSNGPEDIASSSGTRWEFNRLAHPEIDIDCGVSGFGIQTNADSSTINISLRAGTASTSSFDRLKFFLGNDTASWLVKTDRDATGYELRNVDSLPYREWKSDQRITGFSLIAPVSAERKEFYGVTLENSQPGVLLHSIGVNGARYDQYNIAPLFWKQLPALKADLYIISLGTNEAQRAAFSSAAFTKELDLFIQQLKTSSPGAAILISSAPDSYKGRSSNKILQELNRFLSDYCNKNYIPFWDLYRITNGYGSAYSWARRGLMSRDRIHFTAEGYRLQGTLLLNALAKGYNSRL